MFKSVPITYTRPPYVHTLPLQDPPPSPGSVPSQDSRPSDDSLPDDGRRELSIRSGQSGCSAGIPDSLAFDKIMSGGTCPVSLPRTTRPGLD